MAKAEAQAAVRRGGGPHKPAVPPGNLQPYSEPASVRIEINRNIKQFRWIMYAGFIYLGIYIFTLF